MVLLLNLMQQQPLSQVAFHMVKTPSRLDGSDRRAKEKQASAPQSYSWTSTGPLIPAKNDGRGIKALNDPSIVQHGVYLSFTDFNQAQNVQLHYLEDKATGRGYHAAPQKLWYLIYQNGNASYSTNKDINNPNGWSAPKNFYSNMPDIIRQNIGNGNWVDMWVICDNSKCHLFSSDDNGHLYRSSTSLQNFPNGFGNTAIALSDTNRYALFEASCVYHLETGGYLLLVEAIGTDGNQYFRSWTASSSAAPGAPTPTPSPTPSLAPTTFASPAAPGPRVSAMTLTISPNGMRFLYQGLDPKATGNCDELPLKLALIT
ncbi:glycosyl hydrolase family 62-domain-containing protein [Thelonectria olida]|uniref:Alpha-L-arabinofuranosidase n=1 Tax=Thelonectria olida TaxID=1576542 RepID=A0A9P8VP93_9HYPO|nr:glycosyl hydrolase family 62-domain-containing protein [Thelonectria olida]